MDHTDGSDLRHIIWVVFGCLGSSKERFHCCHMGGQALGHGVIVTLVLNFEEFIDMVLLGVFQEVGNLFDFFQSIVRIVLDQHFEDSFDMLKEREALAIMLGALVG